ncbi:hypothetical protein [Pseudonocardia sp. DLS-67]
MIEVLPCRYRVRIVVATTMDDRYRRSRASARRLDRVSLQERPENRER